MSEINIENTNVPPKRPQASTKKWLRWIPLSILLLVAAFLIYKIIENEKEIARLQKAQNAPIYNGGQRVIYKEKEFDVFQIPPSVLPQLSLFLIDSQGVPFQNFQTLQGFLELNNTELLFAMNAGMYMPDNMPQGLYIDKGLTIKNLDTAKVGYGNFYLQPNGVFAFNDSIAVVVRSDDFQRLPRLFDYATQSGPMLVFERELNPIFKENSSSLYIRNGVGITAEGNIVFAISNEPVNFHLFATLFLEKLKCTNALYLDGAISKMYLPNINRLDLDGNLGPIIALTKKK